MAARKEMREEKMSFDDVDAFIVAVFSCRSVTHIFLIPFSPRKHFPDWLRLAVCSQMTKTEINGH
jgi:hypothetical protein